MSFSNVLLIGIDAYLFKKMIDEWRLLHQGGGGGDGPPIIVPPPEDRYGLRPIVMVSSQRNFIESYYNQKFGPDTIEILWGVVRGSDGGIYKWNVFLEMGNRDPTDIYSPENVSACTFVCSQYQDENVVESYSYPTLTNPWMLWPEINYPLQKTIASSSISNTPFFDIE